MIASSIVRLFVFALSILGGTRAPASPAAELYAADSSFGAAASASSLRDALATMLAEDAVMPDRVHGTFADGRAAVLEAVLRDTLWRDGRVSWQPVRAGVSADGEHGLTLGVMQLTTARGSSHRFKYIAYWVRGRDGWRARVWRRSPAAEGMLVTDGVAPWEPRSPAMALAGEALRRAQDELSGMERRFSDSAAQIGIGPAFLAFGADDAWHVGSPADADFTRGNAAIARAVQGDAPAGTSPVTWSAERAVVASSGDLGVTLGYIVPVTARPDGSRPRFPFFTIWRREASGWKYIAE